MRTSYDSGTAVVNLTSGTGITLGGTAGTIALEMNATTTAALDGTPNIQYVYDLELISGQDTSPDLSKVTSSSIPRSLDRPT